MSCFHCALKRGCECAATTATIPHNTHFGRYSARKLHIICAASRGDFTHTYAHVHTHTKIHRFFQHQTAAVEIQKKVHSVRNLQMESLRGPIKLWQDQAGLRDMYRQSVLMRLQDCTRPAASAKGAISAGPPMWIWLRRLIWGAQ